MGDDSDSGGEHEELSLLQWVRMQLQEYVQIMPHWEELFTTITLSPSEWRDGICFCCIVDSVAPGHVDCSALSSVPSGKKYNGKRLEVVRKAMEVVEEELHISTKITATDFAEGKHSTTFDEKFEELLSDLHDTSMRGGGGGGKTKEAKKNEVGEGKSFHGEKVGTANAAEKEKLREMYESKLERLVFEKEYAVESLMEAQGDVEALHKSLRVERNIRHDLERACQARGLGSLVHTFEGQVSMSSPRPGAKTPLRRGSAVPEPVGNVPNEDYLIKLRLHVEQVREANVKLKRRIAREYLANAALVERLQVMEKEMMELKEEVVDKSKEVAVQDGEAATIRRGRVPRLGLPQGGGVKVTRVSSMTVAMPKSARMSERRGEEERVSEEMPVLEGGSLDGGDPEVGEELREKSRKEEREERRTQRKLETLQLKLDDAKDKLREERTRHKEANANFIKQLEERDARIAELEKQLRDKS